MPRQGRRSWPAGRASASGRRAPVTACAAGAQAIGDAARLIRAGEADIAVCGGTEACIDRVGLAALAAARAVSTGFNDDPAAASRPFDLERDGFVMGEGARILVIEELGHALRRGAVPIAELLGYGTSAEAYHMTSPHRPGQHRAPERPGDFDPGRRRQRACRDQGRIRSGPRPGRLGYQVATSWRRRP